MLSILPLPRVGVPSQEVKADELTSLLQSTEERGQIRDLGGVAGVSVSFASPVQQLLHSTPEFHQRHGLP
jgi:hypothetical protein